MEGLLLGPAMESRLPEGCRLAVAVGHGGHEEEERAWVPARLIVEPSQGLSQWPGILLWR